MAAYSTPATMKEESSRPKHRQKRERERERERERGRERGNKGRKSYHIKFKDSNILFPNES
jgi:hypothetical protein